MMPSTYASVHRNVIALEHRRADTFVRFRFVMQAKMKSAKYLLPMDADNSHFLCVFDRSFLVGVDRMCLPSVMAQATLYLWTCVLKIL